jgi:uncharacterized membrane protein HdeD (DUF308 family)
VTTPTWPEGIPPAADGPVPPTEIRPGAATAPPPDASPAYASPAYASPASAGPAPGAAAATAVAAVGRHWGLVVALGILSVVAGLAMLVWPQETVLVIAVIIGIQLIVNGIVRVVQSFAVDDASGGERVLLALLGIFSILVGVLCLRNILQTVAALAILVGIFWLVAGIIDVIGGLSPGPVHGRGWRLLTGALGIIASIAVLAYPGISLAALVALFGIWLLLYGALAIGTGFALHRETDRVAAA